MLYFRLFCHVIYNFIYFPLAVSEIYLLALLIDVSILIISNQVIFITIIV